MNKQREALKLALDALAEPEQEPVAWVYQNANTDDEYLIWKRGNGGRNWRPLYAAPPTRKPLTDNTLWEMWVESPSDVMRFARAIERAHGIGGEK